MEVCLRGSGEVQCVSDWLGEADGDVKGVDDGLPKVFIQGFIPEMGQVNTMETVLVPAVS